MIILFHIQVVGFSKKVCFKFIQFQLNSQFDQIFARKLSV